MYPLFNNIVKLNVNLECLKKIAMKVNSVVDWDLINKIQSRSERFRKLSTSFQPGSSTCLLPCTTSMLAVHLLHKELTVRNSHSFIFIFFLKSLIGQVMRLWCFTSLFQKQCNIHSSADLENNVFFINAFMKKVHIFCLSKQQAKTHN